jgi:membrane protein DedA with SNARE-associated domain
VIEDLIRSLAAQPPLLIYLIVGIGAAIENVFPPVPADTFALFGAFLAAQGRADPRIVFLSVWIGNVATAILTYELSKVYGKRFFANRVGHWVLHPGQLDQVGRFYERWGHAAIFFSRFIPAVRAVAPIFAGTTHQPFWRTFIPLAVASGIWYGAIVWAGATAGSNWEAIKQTLAPYNVALGIVGGVLLVGIGWWWWKSRRAHRAADAETAQLQAEAERADRVADAVDARERREDEV